MMLVFCVARAGIPTVNNKLTQSFCVSCIQAIDDNTSTDKRELAYIISYITDLCRAGTQKRFIVLCFSPFCIGVIW